ncbi:MAG TPA: hypothetical protein VKY90_14560, partial [Candidatus Dormibacteraeota bacterium]|nr:hypothetical protein [Candidatus Dormibacteraeota bacterium]
TLKADLDAYRESGASKAPPSCSGLRWRWNRAKQAEVDQETGEVWWPQIAKGSPRGLLRGLPSKGAFANGIEDARLLGLAAVSGGQARRSPGRGRPTKLASWGPR